ncbi:MAG TPA: hypothetical protein VLM40_11435, partial [Gemmata sp.]|nr:hypothetical protein [Gemmata sp.]
PAAFADPFNPANFVPVLPGDVIGNHVVFGVERGRLRINEAYSEQVNNPADTAGQKPTQNSHVRFWVELLNPGKQELATSLDNGGAQVYWTAPASPVPFNPYRIEIGRYARPNGAVTEDLGTYLTTDPTNVTGSFNPAFQPEIRFQFDSASVTGNVTLQNVQPNNGLYAPNFALPLPPQGIMLVAPAIAAGKSSEYNPTVPDPMTGMPAPPWNSAVIANVPVAGPLQDAMAYDSGFLPAQPTDANRGDFKRHVVLLRRLANPYMPESPTNPFITVDYMDWVPAFDAVLRLQGQNADRGQLPAPGGYTAFTSRFSLGKVQPQAGLAVPTGTPTATGEPTFTFPQSMVLQQQPSAPIPNQPLTTFGYHNGTTTTGQAFPTYVPANLTAVPPTPAMLTGAVAGGGVPDTIMTPYEWLVHLDRPLINQLELLHVTTGMPHQLTQQFIIPDPAIPGNMAVRTHAAELFTGSSSTSLLFNTQMYRVLDMLRIHGHGEGDPLHGRKYGLININTIQDKRIWDSLFDVQSGNGFNQLQVDMMWNNLIRSRTVNMQQRYSVTGTPLADVTGSVPANPVLTPIPGQTIYDMNAALTVGPPATIYDRPFLPLGVSTINGPTSTPAGTGWVLPGTATAFMGGQGIDDTILRRLSTNPATPGVIDPTQLPYIFQNTGLHPYQQAEAARKILNNTTTVSNVFAVWVTVGYFEVENENVIPPGWPAGIPYQGQIGKEFYIQVPADARRRFFAIIDRTQLGLDPLNYASNVFTHANVKPFFTSVEALPPNNQGTIPLGTNILPIQTDILGQVYSDGIAQPLAAGSRIVVGVGANMEIATVGAVIPPLPANPGVSTVTIGAVLWPTPGAVFTKNHYAGETVSNIIPGNPGPPPWLPVAPATTALQFDVNDPTFQPVVPLWTRVP